MGKIVASYLVKVHLHEGDPVEAPADGSVSDPITKIAALTNDDVKAAIVAGLAKELGVNEVTVSLIERTDD